MVGNIVLQHCLTSNNVSEVICIVRKPLKISHEKLKAIVHDDFLNYHSISNDFKHIDVAYFCIGAYTGALPDAQFKEITVDYTKAFADTLANKSPQATFCFLSGQGADLQEKSKTAFARYKGMAENYLISKKFKKIFIFRPSYIYPVEKRKEPNMAYSIFRFLYPILKPLLGKKMSIKSTELGEAIFQAGFVNPPKTILENQDILEFIHLK